MHTKQYNLQTGRLIKKKWFRAHLISEKQIVTHMAHMHSYAYIHMYQSIWQAYISDDMRLYMYIYIYI